MQTSNTIAQPTAEDIFRLLRRSRLGLSRHLNSYVIDTVGVNCQGQPLTDTNRSVLDMGIHSRGRLNGSYPLISCDWPVFDLIWT
jgi:hypothetical protein